MRKLVSVFLIFLFLISCNKPDETVLLIREQYAPSGWAKVGVIKGDLYAASISKPLYSNLRTNDSREIRIEGLLEGTYNFQFYKKIVENEYWPTPCDTVFQIHEGKTTVIIIK